MKYSYAQLWLLIVKIFVNGKTRIVFVFYSKTSLADNMFVVQHDDIAIGCMGFRLIDGKADVYNVILGNPDYGRKGFMSKALALMCSYILSNSIQNIGLKVLRSNPALNWYLKNGFCEVSAHESFLELEVEIKRYEPCEFQKTFYHVP
jgi:hypothetical protein